MRNDRKVMRYTKMHGLGNDYLFVFSEVPANAAELSVKYSDRVSGIGSDGMIYINYSDTADFSMRIFNADGSEARMCGNGIRCVARFVREKGYTERDELTVETLSGIKRIWIDGDDENVEVAAEAIKIIEAEARSANLTDRVREFIEKTLPQSEEEEDIEEESE